MALTADNVTTLRPLVEDDTLTLADQVLPPTRRLQHSIKLLKQAVRVLAAAEHPTVTEVYQSVATETLIAMDDQLRDLTLAIYQHQPIEIPLAKLELVAELLDTIKTDSTDSIVSRHGAELRRSLQPIFDKAGIR